MLTDKQINDYTTNGFIHITALFSPKVVAELRMEIKRLIKNHPQELQLFYEPLNAQFGCATINPPLRKIRNVAQFSQVIFSVCTLPPLTAAAKDILGSPVGFYGDQVLFKSPITGSAKPLHQDSAYFRIEPTDAVITCWCALDDADETNGCMHYVPGSHKNGLKTHAQLVKTPHLVANDSAYNLVPVAARAGDCIIHNSLTLHMTPANTSHRPRWALLAHYVLLNAKFPPRSPNAAPIIPLN
jgi:hypothetical protein